MKGGEGMKSHHRGDFRGWQDKVEMIMETFISVINGMTAREHLDRVEQGQTDERAVTQKGTPS